MDYKKKEDICMHLGDDYDRFMGAIVPPIFQNSLFVQADGEMGSGEYIYTRVSNPTTEIAEKKIAALQGGEAAKCFASGMAAISAGVMHFIKKDCHIITIANVYGPTRRFFEQYLKKFGVEVTFVSGDSIDEFKNAIRTNTSLIYLESPSSFVFSIQDLDAIAKLAKENGIATIIDNTYATPIHQNPFEYGIDLVVHTASKYLGGHSDIVAGVAIGNQDLIDAIAKEERELFGGIMDPHQSWLLIRGLRTFMVRLKEHGRNGLTIANFLEAHPKVKKVYYPALESHPQHELGKKQLSGGNGLLSFELEASDSDIKNFIRTLKFFQLGPSWGGFESLVVAPTVGLDEDTLNKLKLPKGLVRIHVGLENIDTLKHDLEEALKII